MLRTGLLVQKRYGHYELPKEPSEMLQESNASSSAQQQGELMETNRAVYLQVVGPGGRVMAQIELVFKATTQPYQIPLDVVTDIE